MDKEKKGILLDMEGERTHQICSFLWADNFWIMSHSKEHLEQMLRDLIEEANRWDKKPGYSSEEKIFGHNGLLQISLGGYIQDVGLCCESSRENVRCCRRTDAVGKQGLLDGHCDIQEQICSVEGKVSTSGGPGQWKHLKDGKLRQ